MSTSGNGRSDSPDRPIPFPAIENDSLEEEKRDGPRKKRDHGTHRRTVSGNILSKLTFLRTSSDEKDVGGIQQNGSAMAGAMQESTKPRKRKGSLRKTVLGKGRDRKGSDVRKSPLSSPQMKDQIPPFNTPVTPRPSVDLSSPMSPKSPPKLPLRPVSKASIPSLRSSIPSVDPASSVASAIVSPTLHTDASTDDDELPIPRIPAARNPPSSSGDSYFPVQESIRRKIARQKSPLATQPQSLVASPAVEDEEWDYSDTAFWGYVILIVTWIVFVVGMGSSFGVWGWAWDVGETPKAPPELEDDPTLPIVGYYPALMVLTCVMAWVWVVVAWVGMKYFRHADLRSDDV